MLAHTCNIPHISTGEILRGAVAQRTDLGLKAQSYMDQGELVPDQVMLDLVRDRLNQPDVKTGWILDGFPRNVSQASFLDHLLQEINQSCDRVVNLEVPDQVLISRLLDRGRQDDNEVVIRNRLEIYRQQTAPLIDFYSGRHQLVSVNGDQPIDSVTTDLEKLVNS